MNLDAYQFSLPEDLIALKPVQPRDAARLLVVRGDGTLADHLIADLPDLLTPGDTLVFNDTRVLAAALTGVRKARDSLGADVRCDVNLVERRGAAHWRALIRPGRRLRVGDQLEFSSDLRADILAKEDGGLIDLGFSKSGAALSDAIDQIGSMPLPPYIARRRAADTSDRVDYQTRFAQGEAASVAAPTAGLHFTDALLLRLDARGIARTQVRLTVGMGTFKPLSDEQLQSGRLHEEWRDVEASVAHALTTAPGRVIPVGTTALRTLESAADVHGTLHPVSGTTDIFLKPGDILRVTDGLLTNFHLPGSSLFMLVCTLMGTGTMQAAYAHAIRARYRFYSYGDACLLLP